VRGLFTYVGFLLCRSAESFRFFLLSNDVVMSFLLPLLRHSLRTTLRTRTIIPSTHNVPRFPPINRFSTLPQRYNQSNGPNAPRKPSQDGKSASETPADEKIDSTSEPLGEPSGMPSAQDPVSAEQQAKDRLSGDMHASPGSILSQYTIAPEQPRELESAESGAGMSKRPEYKSSQDRKRERMARIFTWGSFAAFVAGAAWYGRPLEEEESQRFGWGDVSLQLTFLTLVTVWTVTFGVLATITETTQVYACCTFLALMVLTIVLQRACIREVTS